MSLDWELLIDADMTEGDWQFSPPTSATILRVEQVNAPDIGRFALGQATVAAFEFLDIKAYPARAESTRITLDTVGEDPRRIAIRYRYGQFSEEMPNTWRVKIYGSSVPFEPPINPSAILLTLDPRIAGAIPLEEKGIPLGVATLGADGLVTDDQLPTSGLAELVAANLEAVDALADQINSLPPAPTLESLGGEPAGAELRAKQYTDEAVGGIVIEIPPAPTLESLGAEPQGAELRAKQYTDEAVGGIVIEIPPAPTLESLGAEPQGAETRAKTYTDEKVGAIAIPFPNSHFHVWGHGKAPTGKTFARSSQTGAELSFWASLSTNEVGDTVEYEFLLAAGTYILTVYGAAATNRCTAAFYIDGDFIGSINYFSSTANNRKVDKINFSIAASGYHSIKVVNAGGNAIAAENTLALSVLRIDPQAMNAVSPFRPIRTNAGKVASGYTDPQNNLWLPNAFYAGGATIYDEAQLGTASTVIQGTDKPSIYRTECSGASFAYRLPVIPGNGYTLHLHFCENFHSSAGQRVGSVSLNGATILNNFDVFTDAGGKHRALVKTFPNLTFTGEACALVFSNTLINGIELIKTG